MTKIHACLHYHKFHFLWGLHTPNRFGSFLENKIKWQYIWYSQEFKISKNYKIAITASTNSNSMSILIRNNALKQIAKHLGYWRNSRLLVHEPGFLYIHQTRCSPTMMIFIKDRNKVLTHFIEVDTGWECKEARL